MTQPTFAKVKSQEELDAERKANQKYLPVARARGKLMIVRPIEYQKEGFVTIHKPEGTDVVFCDIALLDAIAPAEDEYGQPLPGYPVGEQFRRQSILQGFLKGTFKRHVGDTLLGTIYFGPREKGKPPMMWQDLSADAGCVQRGQQFLLAHQEFLLPAEATFSQPQVEPVGPQPYVPPAAGPYAQPDPHAQGKPMSTLEAMRAQMQQTGAHPDVPF